MRYPALMLALLLALALAGPAAAQKVPLKGVATSKACDFQAGPGATCDLLVTPAKGSLVLTQVCGTPGIKFWLGESWPDRELLMPVVTGWYQCFFFAPGVPVPASTKIVCENTEPHGAYCRIVGVYTKK